MFTGSIVGTRNVTVNGKAVARIGDSTDHTGVLENGDASWLIKTSLSYRKVSWSHVVAGTEASDDWRKPA